MRYNAIPGVVYTNPEVAGVGLTEAEAKAKGVDYKVVKLPMAYAGRFVAENERGEGICKVIVGAKYHEVLGVHMLGNPCSEIISAACFPGSGPRRPASSRPQTPKRAEGQKSWLLHCPLLAWRLPDCKPQDHLHRCSPGTEVYQGALSATSWATCALLWWSLVFSLLICCLLEPPAQSLRSDSLRPHGL